MILSFQNKDSPLLDSKAKGRDENIARVYFCKIKPLGTHRLRCKDGLHEYQNKCIRDLE